MCYNKIMTKLFTILAIISLFLQPLAAGARYFDANDIFTDKELFNGNALSRTAIQRFLEAKNSVLKSVSAVVDGAPKLVSEMIYELGQRYGVSQKFLLAKLQHEQGLIEKAAASEKALDWAAGYSCYNGRCNEKYRGIYAQLDAAADVQKIYAERSQSIGYFQFSNGVESKTSDGAVVKPANQATTNLYIYTPYKGGPSGIGGNYAFWRVWNRYFTDRSFADGALLKDQSMGEYWKIEKNKRRKFISEEIFLKDYQLSDATAVSSERLAYYQEGAPIEFSNNTVVKVADSGLMYLLSDGQKRRIVGNKALSALGYRLAAAEATLNATETVEAKIAKFGEGEPVTEQSVYPQGLVAKNESTGELFFIKDGERRPLEPAVKQINFGNTEPVLVSGATLQSYKLGEPVKLREGAVVKNSNGQWYIVSNNEKHAVTSGEIIRRLYGDSVYNAAPTVTSAVLALADSGDKIDYMDDTVPDPAPYQSYADRLAAAAEAANIPKFFAVLEESKIPEKLPIASPAQLKIAFHNRGAAVWQPGKVALKLIDENSAGSSLLKNNLVDLRAAVAPGEMAEFVFTVGTPVKSGKTQEWLALSHQDESGGWVEMAGGLVGQEIEFFSAPAAVIVSHTVPAAVSRRGKRPVKVAITIKNINPDMPWTARGAALTLAAASGAESPFYDKADWLNRRVVGVPLNKSRILGSEEAVIRFTLNPKKADLGIHRLVFSLELKDKKQPVYLNGAFAWEREIRVDK